MAKKILQEAKVIEREFITYRNRASAKFHMLFTLLGSFGLVATFYGFEGIINRIDVLRDNPYLILGVGLSLLALTGSLYKRLR